MRLLVYLIGEPGAGKTTLMRAATAGRRRTEMAAAGCCAHLLVEPLPGLDCQTIELGRDRDTFGGTDALPMDVQPRAVALLEDTDARLVLAEGDRLGNERFLQAAEQLGWTVKVVWLWVPERTAAARRAARGGSQQAAWVKGRATKVRRLAERWGAHRLDGRRPPDELAEQLRECIRGWVM